MTEELETTGSNPGPGPGPDPYGLPAPDFRLPDGTHVGRVRLQVADLARSLAYYQDVLGFQVLERSGNVAVLGAGGESLIELHGRPGAAPTPRRGRLGLFHYAILLPDRPSLGAFVRHLTELGERFGASDHLVSEALYLSDPDGLGIEVYADRPRPEWRTRDRQIVMTTEPLDLAGVARAAGTRSWRGMPPGTTIGHVHLHVGDLESAAAFYHETLGLDKMVWSYPGALFLSAGGYHHHLGLNTWARGAAPAGEDDARLLDWELVLPDPADVDAAAESFRAAGHDVEREDRTVVVRDPWGTALRLHDG